VKFTDSGADPLACKPARECFHVAERAVYSALRAISPDVRNMPTISVMGGTSQIPVLARLVEARRLACY
jgi:hypothetical protein